MKDLPCVAEYVGPGSSPDANSARCPKGLEVKTVMNDYGVTDNMIAYRIERHRDELSGRSDEKRTVTAWTPTAVPGDMSDKDITSLFSVLRDE